MTGVTDMTMTWDGDDSGEQADPSEAELESRIRRLDGRDRTIVTLEGGPGYFAVGGSASTGLVVYADLDGSFHQALSPQSSSTESVTVVAGGQPGDYEARLVTTVEVAVTAAAQYLRDGTLSSDVSWETS